MKRLFNLLLVLLIFISGTIDVHAATVPEGNEMGVGTTGTYYNAGIMVKADFYKPSEHGITQDNFKTKEGLATQQPFESVSERTVFERGTREPVLAPLSIQAGGADSNQLAQMYAYGDNSVNNISFLIEKNIFSTPNTGHKAITPRNLSQYSDSGYKASDGILSVNNLFMKDLLKVTANGTNWDATAISNELNTLWNYYVKPGGSGMSNANVYRAQFASMFGGDGTTGNVQDATAYIGDVFNNQIKNGKSVGGFTITSVQQAANIQNLMMASMGLILGNPMGTLSSKGWTAGADYTYKGELILTNMKKWVEKGGNSDINDYHFSIKLEMYASHIANGVWYFDRWDMAFYNATVNASKFYFAVLPGTTKPVSDIGRYSFGYDYNSGDSVRATTTMSQAMIDAHKRMGMGVKMNAKSSGASNYYVSMMGIFQEVIISTTGTTIPTTSNWNFRNMLEFKVQALGNNTINLGYAFLNPSGANPGSNIVAAKPNFKLDATVKSPSNEVPKGEKGSATNDISLQFPGRLSDSVMTALGLKAPTAEWGAPGSEVQALLTLIDRASDPSQITGGGENSKLPVTITINRSIDTGGNEGKMIDELLSSQTVMGGCGHDLKIVSDNGSTAVLSFNIINNAGRCNHKEYKFKSPRLVAQGKTGNDAYVTINNCVVATLMESASNKISFKDNNIPVTNTMNGKTTVTYTYSYNVKSPTFKIDEKAYGASTIDKMYNNPLYTAKGYRVLPENGAGAYPASDWTSGYYMSPNIQRKITFVRMPETPAYNNLGYDSKTPHYAEIKTGKPGNEPFEAMAGTPTTRDLYTSVSGTDFRVDFSTPQTVTQNPSTYRKYTYTLNISDCWEVDAMCSRSCAGHCPGHPGPEGTTTHDGCNKCAVTSDCATGQGCSHSQSVNHWHPDSHTFQYEVTIPIDAFNYFDMSNTEIWRLDEWGIKGGEDYLEEPNPSYEMGTEFWAYNEKNYNSMNGRLMFSKNQSGNSQGTNAPFGDNSGKSLSVQSGLRADLVQQGVALVNGAKNADVDFKATIISDYVVLQTSEGLQVPYFFEQESSTSVRPSSAPDFSGEGGSVTTSGRISWPKQLTYDDFWFKNGKKLQCASRENGWHNASITYGGYNGEYKSLSTKYRNDTHDDFLSNTNPMSDAFNKYGITYTNHPNQVHDGQRGTYGKDASNVQHIKTGLRVPDEIPNGEYDTGKAWARYEREMFVQNNSKLNPKSNTQGKFTMDSSGIYTDSNVPYYDEANKINDIVIHNPVSAEDAIVITNDSKYDLRTNADLMQGGDPVGLLDGNCPVFGCQFSTLECLTALTPHVESCYKDTVDISMHVGGDNAHDHTTDCFHKHNEDCYPKVYEYEWKCNNVSCCHGQGVYSWSLSNTVDPRACNNVHHEGSYLTGNKRLVTGAGGSEQTFGYTGTSQAVTLSPGLYEVEVYGAGSGSALGGKSTGTIRLSSQTTVYIQVGQSGVYGSTASTFGGGGGTAGVAYSGGGASYISKTPGQIYNISTSGLYIVAGGAGGDGSYSSRPGGSGGGSTGGTGYDGRGGHGIGGSQISGGSAGTNGTNGSYGQGGRQVAGGRNGGGGGGGGYYGGGAGGNDYPRYDDDDDSGGGGGSGYIGGVTGGAMTNGVNPGHGKIIIKSNNPICGKQENVCTNVLNKHVCKSCTFTYKKQLVCTDPHHYIPGEPTDETSPKYHYPLGDPRCWKRCGDDKKHGTPDNIELPNGDKASMGGTFINLDREFKIYFPFTGDFAESPAMNGIANTTDTRGKGYINDMNVKEWTSYRWVKFPVNVIDPKGDMRLAMTQIDLNELSMDDTTFTFYAVLANNEMSAGEVKFTAQANNGPGLSDTYYDESNDVTNKERIDYKFKARHTAHKFQYIDVVGYIGALAINDTGDFRFANLFKKAKDDGSWLIPNLVPEVQFNRPNYIVADNITTRRDAMLKEKQWLDVYGNMKNTDGGKSGGTGNAKEPLKLPLVPRYNNIVALRNQPMRPGYQLYMDTETIGNYYGETMDMNSGLFVDTKMQSKMQIRPQYFSLDLTTSVYTPVDVYYGVNNEYMQVNDFNYGNVNEDNVGVQDYYYYLDWLNEAARRNFTNLENAATQSAKVYRDNWVYGSNTSVIRQPNSERDVIGSANVLFLNDLNRTFIGSSKTYEQDKNPGKLLPESQFNEQSQRWHFSIGLPSSAVFVESDKPCTEIAIKELQSNNRVIVATLDIKVQGDVWTLQYDGTSVNNDGFVIYEGGKKYDPPMIDKDGKPTTDPDKDVTSNNPIYVVYPSNKTSKDDVDNNGIQ